MIGVPFREAAVHSSAASATHTSGPDRRPRATNATAATSSTVAIQVYGSTAMGVVARTIATTVAVSSRPTRVR